MHWNRPSHVSSLPTHTRFSAPLDGSEAASRASAILRLILKCPCFRPLIPAGKVKPVDRGSRGYRYRGRIVMGVTSTWAENTRLWDPRKGCLQLDDKTCGIPVVKHRWRALLPFTFSKFCVESSEPFKRAMWTCSVLKLISAIRRLAISLALAPWATAKRKIA